jgi:hypothetical protein
MHMDRDNSLMHGIASFGPFRLIAAERQLKKGDEPLQLGSRALDTLIVLVERAGEVVTQRELISRVWPDAPGALLLRDSRRSNRWKRESLLLIRIAPHSSTISSLNTRSGRSVKQAFRHLQKSS